MRLKESWQCAIELIVQGRIRQGNHMSLSYLSEGEWRAVFSSHPLTSPDGFAVDRVPW